MNLSEIKENPTNPRTITKEKFKELKESLRDFPEMLELRPLVIDDDGFVLGGNMRLKALLENGMTEVPDSWIRKASTLTDKQKERFIIVDNLPFGEWDWDALANEWDLEELRAWGLEVPDIDPDIYSKKIKAPTYEPSDETPLVEDLYDENKYVELVEKIEAADIPEDLRAFLTLAASRHIVFRYDWIADYYSNATKEIQELFEQSALVVIDFEKAIEGGFVQLSKYLLDIREGNE